MRSTVSVVAATCVSIQIRAGNTRCLIVCLMGGVLEWRAAGGSGSSPAAGGDAVLLAPDVPFDYDPDGAAKRVRSAALPSLALLGSGCGRVSRSVIAPMMTARIDHAK